MVTKTDYTKIGVKRNFTDEETYSISYDTEITEKRILYRYLCQTKRYRMIMIYMLYIIKRQRVCFAYFYTYINVY